MLKKAYEAGALHALKKLGSFPEALGYEFSVDHPNAVDESGNPVSARIDASYNLAGPLAGAALGAGVGYGLHRYLSPYFPDVLKRKVQGYGPLASTAVGALTGSRIGSAIEAGRTLSNSKITLSPKDASEE